MVRVKTESEQEGSCSTSKVMHVKKNIVMRKMQMVEL